VGRSRCTVVEVIYGGTMGGSEMLAFNLCREWKAEGWHSRICCLYRGGPMTDLFDDEGLAYDVLNVEQRSFPFRRWGLLLRYFWHWRPRAIHVHHFGCLVNVLLPAYLAGCFNVVYTEHSSYRIMNTTWMRRMLPWVTRVVRRTTCVSGALADFFHQEMKVPRKKMATITNGVDTQRFFPRTSTDRQEDVIHIGAVGRLVAEKDYENLIVALSLLHARGVRFRASIIGDGHMGPALKKLSADLHLDGILTFLGTRPDVPDLLRSFDIYVLSSMSEGMPVAILEAMATGLPIVATAVGGVGELIRPEVNGVLVDKQNPLALAGAIERLVNDTQRRRELGAAAREEVEARFSIKNTSQCYAQQLGLS
jgi:glycosyltransferase involved in cell wall biosynthesis